MHALSSLYLTLWFVVTIHSADLSYGQYFHYVYLSNKVYPGCLSAFTSFNTGVAQKQNLHLCNVAFRIRRLFNSAFFVKLGVAKNFPYFPSSAHILKYICICENNCRTWFATKYHKIAPIMLYKFYSVM